MLGKGCGGNGIYETQRRLKHIKQIIDIQKHKYHTLNGGSICLNVKATILCLMFFLPTMGSCESSVISRGGNYRQESVNDICMCVCVCMGKSHKYIYHHIYTKVVNECFILSPVSVHISISISRVVSFIEPPAG
jgi:hypothetical protein